MMSTIKRKVLTVIEKVAIIKDSESGIKNNVICKKYGLCSSTVSTLLKNKEPLMHAYERNLITSKRLKKCSKADLDEVLYKWYIFQNNAGLPTNCVTMQKQAETFAFQLGYANFSCTSGWLQRFRVRHNIFSTKRNGETTLGTDAKPSQTGPYRKREQKTVSSSIKKAVDDSSIHFGASPSICEFDEESEPNCIFPFKENSEVLEGVNEPSVCLSVGQSPSDFENGNQITNANPDIHASELSKNEESTIRNSMPDNRENLQLLTRTLECDTAVPPSSVCETGTFDRPKTTQKSNHKISDVVDSCLPINLNLLESISTATDCVEKLEYFFKSVNQKDSEALDAINVIRQKLLDLVQTNENKINS